MPSLKSGASGAAPKKDSPTRLLLVDDDVETLESLGDALRIFTKAEIMTADSGSKALALMQKSAPDALVTDYRMPGMNGIELATEAKKRAPGLVVLIITAFNDAELRDQAVRVGVCDVIRKPLDIEDLVASVQHCWEASQ